MRFGAVGRWPLAVCDAVRLAVCQCRRLYAETFAVWCVRRRSLCMVLCRIWCYSRLHVSCAGGVPFRVLVGVRGHVRWCISCRPPRRVTRLSALCSCTHAQAMRRAHRLDSQGVCHDACCVLCAVPCHAVPHEAMSRAVLCCVLYCALYAILSPPCCVWALCCLSCAVAWAVL